MTGSRQVHHADRSGAGQEAVFLAELESCHAQAREALAAHQWTELDAVARQLNSLSTRLSVAIAGGFTSLTVERRLNQLIDFFHKALAQASAADTVLRQKEDDLLQERQSIVDAAATKR